MKKLFIIALDQGTSSCRAVAVDARGEIYAKKQVVFSPKRPHKGLSYYDGKQLLDCQLGVLHQLLAEIGPEQVAAIAVCSQRSTVVLWDKQTGHPVAPVLTWEDGRSVAQANQSEISQEEIHIQTGLFKVPFFSAPKIAWCLQHVEAVQQVANRGQLLIAPVASFFIWHLTRGRVFATDPTLAQRTLLWDIHLQNWSEALCQVFGAPIGCLPPVRASAADYGTYHYKGVKIPICACVADQQAATVSHSLQPEEAVVNYGTGAFVLYHAGNKPVVVPGMLSSVGATTQGKALPFLLEGPIFSAGSLLQWLQTRGVQVEPNQLDALAKTATSPVRILPALGGLGAPYWDYHAKVVTENVSLSTTQADWIAGALHAIAGRVADIMYYLQAQGYALKRITATGGLSNSTSLLQRQADFLGRSIWVAPQREGTVLGAAQLAAIQLGWDTTPWQAVSQTHVLPCVSTEEAGHMYLQWREFVQRARAVKTV